MSIWFDKTPASAKGTHHGTALFGAIPSGKYTGPLVKVKPSPPKGSHVGYYIPVPSFAVPNLKTPKQPATIKRGKGTTGCLVDSGTGNDILPFEQDACLKATGLIEHGGFPTYNAPCDSIPTTAAIAMT